MAPPALCCFHFSSALKAPPVSSGLTYHSGLVVPPRQLPHRLQDRRCIGLNVFSSAPDFSQNGARKYYWDFSKKEASKKKVKGIVRELPVDAIRRPLARTRENDQEKVAALMDSIKRHRAAGTPSMCLEVEGQYYGFSGCHRYEAAPAAGAAHHLVSDSQANRQTLRMHMM
eukprot:jgi/Botrbrau1/7492/Bobra.0095s0028.1